MIEPPINFCPHCGFEPVRRRIEGRERDFCERCDRPFYRNPKPCAGVLVVDEVEVLLVERTQPPAVGSWSVLAGYLEFDEPPRAAAVRELEEETAVIVDRNSLSLFDTAFVEHPGGSYVLVLVYVTAHSETNGNPVAGTDAGAARFWSLEQLVNTGHRIEPGYRPIFEAAIEQVRT